MKRPSEHRRGDFFLDFAVFGLKFSVISGILPIQPTTRGGEVGDLKVAFRGVERPLLGHK